MDNGSNRIDISRRGLLTGVAALGASLAAKPVLATSAFPGSAAPKFRFIHFTDLHIQPELGAEEGVRLAVKKILSLRPRPDFILTGGDHVMDVLNVTRERADLQFRLLAEALKPLEMPVYSTIGNHDVYGWSDKSSVTESDPAYGIRMFEDKFAKRDAYYAFDHKGWHIVILNSIQAKGKNWIGGIDDAQMSWLANDLEKAGDKPIIVLTHIPALTIFPLYEGGTTAAPSPYTILPNGRELQALFQKHKVKVVLQGHTHVVEECDYLGTKYITGGAVSGEWWKGPRLGVHPEGFLVVDVHGENLKTEYLPYGWKARSA